jgi:hypothetical protein
VNEFAEDCRLRLEFDAVGDALEDGLDNMEVHLMILASPAPVTSRCSWLHNTTFWPVTIVYHSIMSRDMLIYLSRLVVTSKNSKRKPRLYGIIPKDAMSSGQKYTFVVKVMKTSAMSSMAL